MSENRTIMIVVPEAGGRGGGDEGKSRVRHTQSSLQTSRGRYEQKEKPQPFSIGVFIEDKGIKLKIFSLNFLSCYPLPF